MNKAIFIDTNIIIDVLSRREGLYESSLNIIRLCETGTYDGYISALSLANILYICKKSLDKDSLKNAVYTLAKIFKVIDLKEKDIIQALTMSFSDHEDSLQAVAAESVKASYIITRNLQDFKSSVIKAIAPEDFIKTGTLIVF